MQKINLRELYPDIYKTDTYLEISDEVQAVFLADKRAEARYLRQVYNYKAHYSLDCDNGIEKAVVQHPLTPEEILEDKQLRDQLYAAVMDKLFRSDQRPCDPDGGTSGAMTARGLKDTSSRPAKDLGGTLRRTL